MKISEHSEEELAQRLKRGELLLRLHPFVARFKSDVPALVRDVATMYAEFDTCSPETFADFHVEVRREPGLRRWFKPLTRFFFDGQPAFTALPAHQAFAMLEWGLNWCVAAHSHQYLVIHAAVIEKQGRAMLLPAPPGSGKSTLSAGLVMRGWRLLSDELALFDLQTGVVRGMARPINLKNSSIDLIRQEGPQAVMTARVPNTTKGTVALLRAPAESVRRAAEPVRPEWVILPAYEAGAAAELQPRSRADMFMLLAEQSFNYDLLGRRGFDAVGRLLDRCQCFRFRYSRLDDAERLFDALLAEPAS